MTAAAWSSDICNGKTPSRACFYSGFVHNRKNSWCFLLWAGYMQYLMFIYQGAFYAHN